MSYTTDDKSEAAPWWHEDVWDAIDCLEDSRAVVVERMDDPEPVLRTLEAAQGGLIRLVVENKPLDPDDLPHCDHEPDDTGR
jgi:hypothetical protein